MSTISRTSFPTVDTHTDHKHSPPCNNKCGGKACCGAGVWCDRQPWDLCPSLWSCSVWREPIEGQDLEGGGERMIRKLWQKVKMIRNILQLYCFILQLVPSGAYERRSGFATHKLLVPLMSGNISTRQAFHME